MEQKIKFNKTEWNLKPLFKNDNDPEIKKRRKFIERESRKFINKWGKRDDYLKNPSILKQALDEYKKWKENCAGGGMEEYYFWLKSEKNQTDPEIKARYNQIQEFANKIGNDMQFFYLRVAKIPVNSQNKFLKYPGLKNYKHFLEMAFAESKYLLSDVEEKIMNLKSAPAHSNWVKMTSEFLSKEERIIFFGRNKKEKKNFSEILSLINSKDKKIRDDAAKAINDIVVKNAAPAEAELNSILQNKKVDDELRKISRPDLTRHISDDIDSKTVDALLDAVSGKFYIAQKYYKLKSKLLKLKKLEYHERNVPYGNIGDYDLNEAAGLVAAAFKKLDPEFYDIFSGFIKNGQIDVYPKKGKTSGAFCACGLITLPVYVLLNYDNKFTDVTTIAHEMGHAINDMFMKKSRNAIDFGSPLSTAEVASTFMEDFVISELMENANNDETKLAILMTKLNDDVSTIFRQVACYKFEQELHKTFREKGYLPKEEIGKIFQKHMQSYMGSSVEQSQGSQNWWVYWSHIRNFFYVYSYASGLLISKSLQSSVRKNPAFINKIKADFLPAGLSDSPKNTFKKMGVDITKKQFWNKGLAEVEALLDEAETLAKKLGKI